MEKSEFSRFYLNLDKVYRKSVDLTEFFVKSSKKSSIYTYMDRDLQIEFFSSRTKVPTSIRFNL